MSQYYPGQHLNTKAVKDIELPVSNGFIGFGEDLSEVP
jgi:hypothetical protein